jgi:hypothetical protein
MTTGTAPAAATASTARNTSRRPTPARTATSTASWMTGPSMPGSLYGTPISITSAPASTAATIAAMEASTSG